MNEKIAFSGCAGNVLLLHDEITTQDAVRHCILRKIGYKYKIPKELTLAVPGFILLSQQRVLWKAVDLGHRLHINIRFPIGLDYSLTHKIKSLEHFNGPHSMLV